LVKTRRKELRDFQTKKLRPRLCLLESKLAETLKDHGFSQVITPTTISKEMLAKMSINENHSLFSKVFWLDDHRCLRPMLAPNLYHLLRDLDRIWDKPIRIFEIGSCFRKDSHGSQHSPEFTMLNLVELGLPEDHCRQRLEGLVSSIMTTVGIDGYALAEEKSEVYGHTIDIISTLNQQEKPRRSRLSPVSSKKSTVELGSAAIGPHPLDHAWGITEPWVGIGFGLERLLMAKENGENISRWGRSLTYLDGGRLNI
jgi:pyrrolysyl-tRNA synthetase-like protein